MQAGVVEAAGLHALPDGRTVLELVRSGLPAALEAGRDALEGPAVPLASVRLLPPLAAPTVRDWVKRFNAQGLAGLEDQPRAGRLPTYTPEQVATVIATALTDPKRLDLPFGSWTLDRLAAYLSEHKGIAIKRSRIDEILLKEGLRWRRHETWFGERVDPAFAEKRGGSRASTPPRLQAA